MADKPRYCLLLKAASFHIQQCRASTACTGTLEAAQSIQIDLLSLTNVVSAGIPIAVVLLQGCAEQHGSCQDL